jgi:hypothetical protein
VTICVLSAFNIIISLPIELIRLPLSSSMERVRPSPYRPVN